MGASLCCFQSSTTQDWLDKPRGISEESTFSEDNLHLPPMQKSGHFGSELKTFHNSSFSNSLPTGSADQDDSRRSATPMVRPRCQVSQRTLSVGLTTILEEPAASRDVPRTRTTSSDSFEVGSSTNFGSMKSYKRFVTKR